MISWTGIFTAGLAVVVSTLVYFINDLLAKRRRLNGLPQPPMKSLLFGHLDIADECQKVFPKGIHGHVWGDYIREKWKLPETFYIDWRPFGPLWLFSADPELVVDHVAFKQNLAKSHLETDYLNRFLGKNNLVSLEGAHHKIVRSMFNPGFSTNNIMTYVDKIVDAGVRFRDVLIEKAKTGELFELEEYATRLTIDVIGLAVYDFDFDAQNKLHPIVEHFRIRTLLMPGGDALFPWQDVSLTRPYKLWQNGRKLDAAIEAELENSIQRRNKALEAEAAGNAKARKRRSIVDLALNAWEKEVAMESGLASEQVEPITSVKMMPERLRNDLKDSIKTFFFAGHDTTSSTLSWALYLLHRYPAAHKRLMTELDTFFPPGTSIADKIKEDPYIINRLDYTTAVLKETIRVFPPASTLRQHDPKYPVDHTTFVDPRSGHELFLDGVVVWPTAHMIGRNKRIFPKPTHFIPERWLPSETPFPDAELFGPAGKYGSQAFMIGPRTCIGQELAMIESRIVLALVARDCDFVLEFPGEEPDPQPPIPESTAEEFDESTAYGQNIRKGERPIYVEGHRVWQLLKGSAKPCGGCPGRIKLRTQEMARDSDSSSIVVG